MSKPTRQLSILVAAVAVIALHTDCLAADSFTDASALYEAGQWQAAATAFDRAVQDAEYDKAIRSTAQLYAGECLVQLGKYAEARQRYQQVRHQAPSAGLGAQALFRLGEVAWLAGERAEAERLLQSYVESYPQGASISYAQDYLQKIAEHESQQVNFEVLDEAVGRERDGQYDAALAAYGQLLQQTSLAGEVRSETLRRAAQLHERLAQPSEAIGLYQQYLAESPHSKRVVEVMIAVAWSHVRLNQTTQAADQFQAVCEKFPQSAQAAEAAYWLAQQSADEENSERASRFIDFVLARKRLTNERPELMGKALCLKCQLLSRQDQWPEIETLVENEKETIDEGPLRTKLEFWSAESAFRQRHYDVARERFAELQPKIIGVGQAWTAMVPLRRAQLASRRQQWSETLKILDQMGRDFPEFELDYEIDYLRGRALAGRGSMTAARKFYRQVIDNPKATKTEAATMAGWMIGETYFHQRDYPRARTAYQTVMEQTVYPEWQSRAALQAGKCWELEQRWDEASQVYATALQRWPNSLSESQLESRLRWAQNQTIKDQETEQR